MDDFVILTADKQTRVTKQQQCCQHLIRNKKKTRNNFISNGSKTLANDGKQDKIKKPVSKYPTVST